MANVRHLENVCRLCLTDASEAGHMLPIFPVRGGNPNSPTSMVYRIFQCTSLKLEQKEGIPSTICELCSVRLEDWFAFREQCLGSDEYLRVALAHIYSSDVQATIQSPPPTTSQNANLNNGVSYAQQQQHRPQTNESASRPSPAPPSVSPTDGTSTTAPRSSSLAKRRRSIFEWSVDDGKGQATGQKVIVELLDDGVVPSTGETVAPPKRNDHQQTTYEPILPSERPNGGGTPSSALAAGSTAVLPEDASGLLEQATWSKEYCARVNSLMVLVTGTRPYKCKICRKLFKARSNLRRHIKVNHADEVFEGESPPPECYDFGHIDRAGGAAFWKPPTLPGVPDAFQSAQQQLLQQQRAVQNLVHHPPNGGQLKKKRRSVNDPPITGPYQCQICPRSFKMPAHLAVHMKTHQKVEGGTVVPSAIELQVQQQLLQRQSRTRTNIEPTDIIQLSDDDDDNEEEQRKQQQQDVSRPSEELDDGFDEEEGSLKEGASNDQSGEQLQPEPASMPILESHAIKSQPVVKEDDDDDDVVIQDVKPVTQAPQPAPPPPEVQVKPKRIPAPGTIPPGPLSMKQRYRASMESGALATTRTQSPHETKPKPYQFIVARPKHSPVPSTPAVSTPPPSPVASESQSSSPVVTLHRCHFCQQTFPREDLLREHQKTHQRDAPMPFRCRWCQKGFRYRQNYTLHVEKQTCRLLNGETGVGQAATIKPPSTMPTSMARPIAVANKRGAAW